MKPETSIARDALRFKVLLLHCPEFTEFAEREWRISPEMKVSDWEAAVRRKLDDIRDQALQSD